ncbi:30S ribosomal protein S4 [bacterium]|nr:30S ribosomal protein S4 [bacterium]
MARYTGPVCRLCRREGEKLFLKGERCYTTKCTVERREGSPGQHGKMKGRFSEYKVQLREKQKMKRIYGVLERQFRKTFGFAERKPGITGHNLLISLEARLDNMVHRAGFASSRREARQFVQHGHFMLNGTHVNIPSTQVKAGDVISVIEKSRPALRINQSMALGESRKIPDWIELDKGNFRATVKSLPVRSDLPQTINEQLVVELYSK